MDKSNSRALGDLYSPIVALVAFVATKAAAEIVPIHPESSGTAWHAGSGFLVTAAHVVEGAKWLSVVDYRGVRRIAEIVGLPDRANDVAVLQARFDRAPPTLTIAKEEPKLGESVFTMGFPYKSILGTKTQVTSGEVGGQKRPLDERLEFRPCGEGDTLSL